LLARASNHYSGLVKLLKNDPYLEHISGKVFLTPELQGQADRDVPLDFLERLLVSTIPDE